MGEGPRAAREMAQTRQSPAGKSNGSSMNDGSGMDEEGHMDEGGDVCYLAQLPQNKPNQGGRR